MAILATPCGITHRAAIGGRLFFVRRKLIGLPRNTWAREPLAVWQDADRVPEDRVRKTRRRVFSEVNMDEFKLPPMLTVRGLTRDEIHLLSLVALRLGHRSREDLIRKLCRGVIASAKHLVENLRPPTSDLCPQTTANQVVSAPVSISTPDSAAQQSTAASTP